MLTDLSYSVDSLVTIAQEALNKAAANDKSRVLSHLIPSGEVWEASLNNFLRVPPQYSTAILSPLGGATYLVDRVPSEQQSTDFETLSRDVDHFSSAFRHVYYTTKLLSNKNIDHVESHVLEGLFLYLPLVVQLIDDELSAEGSTELLLLDTMELRDECVDIVSDCRRIIKSWVDNDPSVIGNVEKAETTGLFTFWKNQLQLLQDNFPRSYRVAEAFAKIADQSQTANMSNVAEECFKLAKGKSSPVNPFVLISAVAGFKDTIATGSMGTRLCNELIADLTGSDLGNESQGKFYFRIVLFHVLKQL